MNKLDNIEKSIYEIKAMIQADGDIRKLIYHDVDNALSGADVLQSAVEDYIVVSPVFDMTQEPFNKNTIISVALVRGMKQEDEQIIGTTVRINILTQSTLWKLVDNKIRPTSIASRIIDSIDGKKTSSSHKLSFNKIELIVLNENISGYSLLFFLTEGGGRLGDF